MIASPGIDRVDVGKIIQDRRHDVLLRQRHALGAAGGAAGVEQPGRIIGRARGDGHRRAGCERGVARAVRVDHFVQTVHARRERRHRVVEIGAGETQARAAVLQDEFEFARMQLGVDRHRAQARVPAGEHQLDVLRAILHHQRDALAEHGAAALHEAIAMRQPLRQPGRQARDARRQLGVAAAHALAARERRQIRVGMRAAHEELGDIRAHGGRL